MSDREAAILSRLDAMVDQYEAELADARERIAELEVKVEEAMVDTERWVAAHVREDIESLAAERDAARRVLAWYVAQHGLNSYAADGLCKCERCKEARPLLGEARPAPPPPRPAPPSEGYTW